MPPKEKEERQICCCGAFTWAKVLAYIQIMFGGITLVTSLISVIAATTLEESEEEDPSPDFPDVKFRILLLAISAVTVSLLILILGVILLVGFRKDNTRCLFTWIVLAVIVTLLETIRASLVVYWIVGSWGVIVNVFPLVATIGVHGFGVWIVHVCRLEMKKGRSGRGSD